MVGGAAFCQVHQQLGGQFADLVVFVFLDVGQLGEDHQVNQLLLQRDKTFVSWLRQSGLTRLVKERGGTLILTVVLILY